MRRRAVLALMLSVAVFLAVPTGVAGGVPSSSGSGVRHLAALQAPPAVDDPALADLGACVAERNRLSVLFLIDESGSLRETDPEAARVTAVKTALIALGGLAAAEVDGVKPDIDVRFAGFAESYIPYGDWTPIENDDAVTFMTAAAEQFAERNRGFDTDYVAALEGAQDDLADHAVEMTEGGGQPPCQALAWFTDGKLDIEDRDTSDERDAHGTSKFWAPDIDLGATGGGAAAEARGRELLCQGRGGEDALSDQLRSDDVTSIGLALTGQAFAQQDQDFLEGLVTGSSPAGPCGHPGATPQGTFLPATDLTQLILAFNRAFNQGGTSEGPVETPICQTTPADRCTRTFDVDRGLRRFNLLVINEAEGVTVKFTGPNDSGSLAIEPAQDGEGDVGAAHLRWHWASPEVVSVSAVLDQENTDWAGTWSASFVSSTGQGVATSELFLYGNLQPTVPDDLEFTLAAPTDIPITVVPQEGTPETPTDIIRESRVVASVHQGRADRQPVRVDQQDNLSFTGHYRPPADLAARTVRLRLELSVTTTSGIQLEPVLRDFDVPVTVPPVYPSIVETVIHPPSISGDHTTSADVHVKGSTIADGCVWFEGFDLADSPSSVDGVEVTTDPTATADDCLEVKKNQDVTIHVTLDPGGAAQGAVEGALQAVVNSDRADEPIPVPIPTSFRMSVPPDEGKRWLLFVALMAVGVLIPLLFLWGSKWLSSKFEPPARMSGMALRIVVSPGRTVSREGGAPLDLGGTDLDKVLPGSAQERARSFTWEGFRFWASSRGNPFEAPKGWVAPPEGDTNHVMVSGWIGATGGKLRRNGTQAELPLHLRGSWFFVARVDDVQLLRQQREAATPGTIENVDLPGVLYGFVEDGLARGEEAAQLSAAILADLAGVVLDLASAVPLAPPPVPPPNGDPPPPAGAGGGPGPARPSMDPQQPPDHGGGSARPSLDGPTMPGGAGPSVPPAVPPTGGPRLPNPPPTDPGGPPTSDPPPGRPVF